MTLALRFAASSHIGLLRTGNEDSVYAGPRLLAVADGMGGAAAGEVASAVAIASLAPLDEDAPGADLLAALRHAAVGANDHLRDMVAGDVTLDGMGTTLTAVLFTGRRLGLLHIGDSRCYLLRDGRLNQITHDDTLVQALVDEGRITPEEASSHPQRSLITRALDGRTGIDFDTSVREARAGDRYLLCTDGLTGPVGSLETLREALELPDPQQAVDRLVQLALKGGGPDNITLVVADVVDGAISAVPVVAGAAADAPQATAPHRSDSPAGRAYAASAPVDPPAAVRSHRVAQRARRGRTALLASGVLVLLVVTAGSGWAYLRSQWYVGSSGTAVGVFRGVSGSIAGVDLSRLQERTDLQMQRLTELDVARVQRGIRAEDRRDAARILGALQERAAPACPGTPADERCPPPAPSPSPTPPPLPPPIGTPTASPAPLPLPVTTP